DGPLLLRGEVQRRAQLSPDLPPVGFRWRSQRRRQRMKRGVAADARRPAHVGAIDRGTAERARDRDREKRQRRQRLATGRRSGDGGRRHRGLRWTGGAVGPLTSSSTALSTRSGAAVPRRTVPTIANEGRPFTGCASTGTTGRINQSTVTLAAAMVRPTGTSVRAQAA